MSSVAGSSSAGIVRVVNPATELTVAEIERQGKEAADAAVGRAVRAFPAWRDMAPGDRTRLLRRFAEQVEAHAEELALLETRNVGKPITDSRGEVAMVADVLHFYSGAVDKHRGATIPVAGGVDLTWPEPLGVVAAIVPWNFPIAITSWKIGPALACGNTVVVKPAELTPLTAVRLAELALDAGIPEGVLQVVVGRGTTVGTVLVEHPDVAKVAFTGSTEAGRDVMARASGTIKRVTLELGGKSANVVFADADLERAAASAPFAVFGNAGQDCCARSRILVERAAFGRFVELLVTATEALVVGDPEDPATQMGPLVSDDHRARVNGYLHTGDTGLEIVGTSPVPDGPGWWFPATVLAPVDPQARVWREEIFGPVVAVTPFDDEADAVALANDTPYGLSGSIWTRDSSRALRMAKAVQAGVLSVNSNTSVRVNAPFGGMKQSGFGRELGMEAMASFSDLKNVFLSTEG
ncbi:MAG TPA: aldehyde dehydrogenase family protein [Acidimicrobiales bacterium]|nr:aldehyde dehydrogenase family protein [Acidimicrobiales bacterium]